MKKLFLFLPLIFFIISCKTNHDQKAESSVYFQWTDSYDRSVSLDKEPERVISLSPAITEMIFLLGSSDKLVGITEFCEYPPETANTTKVGGLQNLNIEYLLSLQPDVILIGSIIPKNEVEKMEQAGIPVIAIREENKIEGIYSALSVLGRIFNKTEAAEQEVSQLKIKMDKVKASLPVDSSHRPTVYFVVGFGDAGDYTAPNNSHIHEIITLAGGKNIGENLKGWNISREYLFQEDPEIIIIRKDNKDRFCSTFPYKELTAVKEGEIYPIESGWIDIVSPRNILAIEMINEVIIEHHR